MSCFPGKEDSTLAWIEVKAFHVGTFGGVYPTDASADPLRWINMHHIFSIVFSEEKDGTAVVKLETERSGTFLIRDPFSVEVIRDYLQVQRARLPGK